MERSRLASKGVIRTGEAYCLSCFQLVDRDANRCPGCYSELTDEVKAFKCPKCQQMIALGEPQCPKCGLKFKVKTLKSAETAHDDQFLMKLIEWGKSPEEAAAEGEAPKEKPAPGAEAVMPGPSEEQLRKLAQLKESIGELMKNRSEMLERMEKRMEAEKARLERIASMADQASSTEQVEAEIMSLADEMADITMLQAHMDALSDEITSLMESVEVSGEAKERGLAAKALRMKLDAKEKELSELKSREEQLAKKEEMVDRKIQAYAAKKKQLDKEEEELKQKLTDFENERARLEILKTHAAGAKTEQEREEATNAWVDEQRKLRQRIQGVKSKVVQHRTGQALTDQEIESAEGDLVNMITELESQIADLIVEKVEIQEKMSEASVVDEDLKRLLKVLDQMLGQLPEALIDKFSKSDEFALYERVLDKFKI
jgi:DNA repair exonuclease SbcCD ATPase subunit/RNA polymerase subunit RPABC4/transcription elongation factor Spt4